MKDLFDLSGQRVLVTGATQGLGLSISQVLVAQGAYVIVSDMDAGACERTVEGLLAEGGHAEAFAANLADPENVSLLCHRAGHVDALVCNAGVPGPMGPLHAASAEDWGHVMGINLRAPERLCAGLMPSMAERGAGSVVLMSSIAGLRGNKAIGLYGLSKAALAQMARNLAVEWGPRGIRVNAVSPGFIHTPLSETLLSDAAFMQRRLAMTPLRRVGQPFEVAGVVAMLVSRAGGFISGQNIVVDGGTLISDGA